MTLPFTPDQFFEVFARYNRALWPFAVGLWLFALAGVVAVARSRDTAGRFVCGLLAILWAWNALAYHVAFFAAINPAAWIFAAAFLAQSVPFAAVVIRGRELRFSLRRSPRHALAAILIGYSLIYPLLANLEGHAYPNAPTFGVPPDDASDHRLPAGRGTAMAAIDRDRPDRLGRRRWIRRGPARCPRRPDAVGGGRGAGDAPHHGGSVL